MEFLACALMNKNKNKISQNEKKA